MKPKIVDKEGFTLVGLKYEGNNEDNQISMLWDEFALRLKEIRNRVGHTRFGYDSWTAKINETGEFTYIAAVEVTDSSEVPEGMVSIEVPKNKYAVFAISSTLTKVEKTVKEIFSRWLPEAGLELAGNYDFEYYSEDFQPNDKDSTLYFYVPIK